MTTPIALQLYTVRDLIVQDFDTITGRIAEIGYAGVETFGHFERTGLKKAANRFRQLSLNVVAAHVSPPLGKDAFELAETLECARLVVSPSADDFSTAERSKQTCDRLNAAAQGAKAYGLQLLVHNHWWEFELVTGLEGGHYPFEMMLSCLDPSICFELDTYWIKTAGHDPAAVVQRFGSRAPLLHIKDGPATTDTESPMVAVGQGSLNFHEILAFSDHAEWLIVELDRCATDMMTAVEESFDYLVEEGLGHGR